MLSCKKRNYLCFTSPNLGEERTGEGRIVEADLCKQNKVYESKNVFMNNMQEDHPESFIKS